MQFHTEFEPHHGVPVAVAEKVIRVTAPNAGPFTYTGTNSYIIGQSNLMVVDPGPVDETQFATLMAAIGNRAVSHILITHTHADHSPLAQRLKAETGASTVGFGPHIAARQLQEGEIHHLDSSADRAFVPDIAIGDGGKIGNGEFEIQAVHTPGHTANHLCFAVADSPVLFSGDHIMAWATTIVAPPDGSMSDYLDSIERLRKRRETFYLPGHGGPVTRPAGFLRGLKAHRLMREAAILERLSAGEHTIGEIVATIYRETDKRLHGAAALTVFAHMERLMELGAVSSDGAPSLHGSYHRI